MTPAPHDITVLHYVGYGEDRGGILSVVRALASAGRFRCLLGVNPGFVQRRAPELPTLEFPAMAGETISWREMMRARKVAAAVRVWLQGDATRLFHGHSRAGLLVALWLRLAGERHAVVTVHCYGKQKWFYRWAAQILGDRLYWLSPSMRRYYGRLGEGWSQCSPGCVAARELGTAGSARSTSLTRLGGIGALVPWKGWHRVVAALALLPGETRRRVSFRHIGGSDGSEVSRRYAADLRAATTAAGLDGVVEWLGEKPSANSLLRELDYLVVASDNEPFSVAMLEALQANVPVIAADSGGAVDLIAPPSNGMLFRSGDTRDLARVFGSVAGIEGAPQLVINHEGLRRFTANVAAEAQTEIYRRVLAT